MELPERKIFTVSELTERIRTLLEGEYPSVWVQGEISNFRTAPSGHSYFTLKDDSAQIRCVMFKLQSRFLKFRLEEGLSVAAWGRLSVYSARGEYQLILDTMEPLGLGSLMLAFEQMKRKLAAEGLFDEDRKKPLPTFPKTVGLVTSARGAAVRDMIRIINRRFPGVHILLSPATVQGDRAPDEIVRAVQRLCDAADVDVIIIGRGGGSVEDLWAFNDERVVRAVADCPLPIVSAVGHETDFTLTDFAADLRASTPSAAAELVVPDRRDLSEGILHITARLRNAMDYSLRTCTEAVSETMKRLYDPRRQIEDRRIRMDDLSTRLSTAMSRKLDDSTRETSTLVSRLRPEHLRRVAALGREQAESLTADLCRATRTALKDARHAAETLSSELDNLSPLAVLSRGYAVTVRQDTGTVITDSESVQVGDKVKVLLHRGRLACTVTDKGDR
jgi:exodeoxyribonuclease VII large subunit